MRRVKIDDHAQIQPQTTRDANVRNVGHPFGVRLVGRKVPLQVILNVRRPGAGRFTAMLFLAGYALDGIFAHQAGDPIQAALFAFLNQVIPDSWRT